jgi:hypothetical protein
MSPSNLFHPGRGDDPRHEQVSSAIIQRLEFNLHRNITTKLSMLSFSFSLKRNAYPQN